MPASTIARRVSRTKAERLVATGRLIACSLVVITAGIGFALHRTGRYDLLIAAVWWIVAAALVWQTRAEARPRATPLLLAFDFIAIVALLATTGGVTSVYFPILVIPPFAAHVLYGRRVVMWVAACSIGICLAMILLLQAVPDTRTMIMRLGVVLLVSAAALTRSAYDERVHRDIEQLATWPRAIAAGREASVREMLQRAAAVLRAPRAVVQWTDRDGDSWLAQLDGAAFEIDDESFDALVAPEIEPATAFLAPDLRLAAGVVEPWSGPFLAPAFAGRAGVQPVIGAKFDSQTVSGWLFVIGVRDASADDLRLAEIVARLVSAGLDQINLVEVMRDSAAASERLRLSRDLHDGLLQSLSGLALHAQAARRSAARDPREAEQRLGMIVEQLSEAQRALRDFVDELRPELTARRREPLDARLRQLADSIARQWDVPISLTIEGDLGAASANDVAAIVGEALSNAAKHAGATRIEASVRATELDVRVDVSDNGRGFPFHGRYELPQLVAEERGPWSLKERVAQLGGELAIDSTSRGSRVEVRLPRAS